MLKYSPLHGLGLFATKPIPRGTRVIPYVGPVVRAPQKAGMSEYQRSYLYKLTPDFSIDGSPAWNLARFMNHRCTGYNCWSEVLNTEDSSLYEVCTSSRITRRAMGAVTAAAVMCGVMRNRAEWRRQVQKKEGRVCVRLCAARSTPDNGLSAVWLIP